MGIFDLFDDGPKQEIPREAVAEGDLEKVATLIDDGMDPNLNWEGNGLTPLLAAVSSGHLEMAALLLEKGADPNGQGGHYDFAPLAMAGEVPMFDLLLEKGALVDQLDSRGETALVNAARNGQEIAVKWLIEAGADVNVINQTGDTALHVGAWGTSSGRYNPSDIDDSMCDKEYIVNALLGAGAGWFTNDDGETPWHTAAKAYVTQGVFSALDRAALGEERNTAFLEKIQTHGNYKGDTFMHILAAHNVNDYDLIDTYQALLVIKNTEGMTPVEIAQGRGYEGWVETALDMSIFCSEDE